MDAALGEIVYSKTGRDMGKQFVVVDIIDSNYVLLSDGRYRRLEKAKKKKVKHIKLTGIVIETLKEKMENQLKITNAEIRKALDFHNSELQNEGKQQNLSD